MEKEVDIVALGELLIDFTEAGYSAGGMKLFEQNPGGAPANLLTVVSHMGYRTAFVGKVGKDMHGSFLKQTLEREGICTDYIVEDENCFTTLAFVDLDKDGERQFSFARKPGADTQLKKEDLDETLLKKCKIFHVGSLSLTDEPSRDTTLEAIHIAKKEGALISYDPNYRASLWKEEKTAIEMMKTIIPLADIMKVSDEESFLLTGEKDYKTAATVLLSMGPKLVAVTLGSDGVYIVTEKMSGHVPAFCAEAVDTTGAGDSFWGGFLSQYLKGFRKIDEMEWPELEECALYGNATAALCVQRRGGIPSIPSGEEVQQQIKTLLRVK